MADPVSISREFTTDDQGDLRVRATVREWPYPMEFAANGLKYDDDGLWVEQAPVLHPLARVRFDGPKTVTIADGAEHTAAPMSRAWTNPGARTAVVSLTWAVRVDAQPTKDTSAADTGHWDVTFTDPAHPLEPGVSHTVAAESGPVDSAWVTLTVPPAQCAAGATFSATADLTITNHTGTELTLSAWTVHAAGFAIEGGH